MEYLDFEHPIKELKEQLDKTVSLVKRLTLMYQN